MKLQKIELENFRSFYGTQELIFSESREKNITLVQGENGTGKTALLNALFWAFHGQFTGNFNNPDMLVNKHAIKIDGCHQCKVTVYFEFKNEKYRLTRTFYRETKNINLEVFKIESNGNNVPLPSKEQFINQAFPKGMAKYFFFDGEFATNFDKATTTKDDARRAINDILGATAAKQALEDIGRLKSTVHNEIRTKTVNTRIKRLEAEREALNNRIVDIKRRKANIPAERLIEQEKLKDADAILAAHADTAKIKEKCDGLEKDLNNILSNISSYRNQKTSWIAQNAIHLASKKIAVKCKEIYEDMERKVQIPAPYHLEFVQSLVESHICICGRPLEEHSDAYKAVHELLSNAPDSKIARGMISIRSFCDGVLNHNSDTKSLQKIDSMIAEAENREIEKRAALESAKKDLQAVPDAELAKKTMISAAAKIKITRLNDEEILINRDITELSTQIRKIDSDIETLAQYDKEVNKLHRRLKFLDSAESKLKNLIDNLETTALETIRNNTNKLLKSIYRQNIDAHITDKYELSLRDSENKIVPPSGGQGLLASLAFLACLIRFCAEREANEDTILSPGTIAPFVLDAPFGQLDPMYRQSAAKFLQEYSNQLILFVSKSHADPETINIIEKHIGSRAILVAENMASQPESQNGIREVISIKGVDYETTLWNCPSDTTTIKSV